MVQQKQAFTLIELLVVVLIIGILAAVAVPQYQVAVNKSRMTQALIMSKSIADAERIHYLANGAYTSDLSELDVSFECTGTTTNSGVYKCADGSSIDLSHAGSVYAGWHGKAKIETYFGSNLRLCKAESVEYHKVCRSLGGVPFGSHEGYYELP
ncbi:MAG: prepilin-type N-terminal cleavage/methylation domain-containing protein [Elusimicrobiaceae bacterium]|nr:prepilin-type N-terminal cleavage/methylation domain-containing protein [Elusimicrobiaceae bacterium]